MRAGGHAPQNLRGGSRGKPSFLAGVAMWGKAESLSWYIVYIYLSVDVYTCTKHSVPCHVVFA